MNMKLCCKTEKKYGLAVLHAKNDGVEEDGLAINVSGVFLDFKTPSTTKQVLQGVNLGIPRGRFHMLLGPNGCGKSTLLRILAGLLKADSGSFSVTPPYGFVFQNPDHQVVMPTVSADVAFGLGRYCSRSERCMYCPMVARHNTRFRAGQVLQQLLLQPTLITGIPAGGGCCTHHSVMHGKASSSMQQVQLGGGGCAGGGGARAAPGGAC